MALLNLWNGFEAAREELSGNRLRRWCRDHYLNYLRLREWHDTFRQLRQLLRDMDIEVPAGAAEPAAEADDDAARQARRENAARLHKALLPGLLSHLGQFLENREYLGARNRKFMIHPVRDWRRRHPSG